MIEEGPNKRVYETKDGKFVVDVPIGGPDSDDEDDVGIEVSNSNVGPLRRMINNRISLQVHSRSAGNRSSRSKGSLQIAKSLR
jgi:hypothetical protein